jgi:uncharacterized protein YaeQ
MALKATIYKATLQIADMDRHVYGDHGITIARHPSETDERMMVRLLAYALNAPADNDHGALEFAKDLWDTDEPALWRRDLTGQIEHWIDVGQPDERRLLRASPRSARVSVYAFSSSTPVWWGGIASRLTRAANLDIWRLQPEQSEALAGLAQRTMQLQVTVQDGSVWIADGERSIEITPQRLDPGR